MEYAGVATTPPSQKVMAHEIAHSFFGRYLMPSTGNHGWIDEAITMWLLGHSPDVARRFADRSSYRASTTIDDHTVGLNLMRELDTRLPCGLMPVLRAMNESATGGQPLTPQVLCRALTTAGLPDAEQLLEDWNAFR